GWLLAARRDGGPLRRAADVEPGAALRLHFTDGRVDATAEAIDLGAGEPPAPATIHEETAA
ncbi:MAG TPA: hypothetical protein VGW10_13520, partial [Solirubrobacteraceae bacterium]|nr:hypothetical protein [Solirubrobacteraceae bacterium]